MIVLAPVILGLWMADLAIGLLNNSAIPFSCGTIGGLSKTIASYNLSKFSSGEYTKKEIWDALCNHISSQFEEVVDIKPETTWSDLV